MWGAHSQYRQANLKISTISEKNSIVHPKTPKEPQKDSIHVERDIKFEDHDATFRINGKVHIIKGYVLD